MKELIFTKEINADKKTVWERMFDPQTYQEWVHVSWPGSFYKGTWGEGEQIRFLSRDGGGTVASLVQHHPYERVLVIHTAVIHEDGTEDTRSDIAKGWIGTEEDYVFSEKMGKTILSVSIKTTPDWEEMFNDGFPNALEKLKEICER